MNLLQCVQNEESIVLTCCYIRLLYFKILYLNITVISLHEALLHIPLKLRYVFQKIKSHDIQYF